MHILLEFLDTQQKFHLPRTQFTTSIDRGIACQLRECVCEFVCKNSWQCGVDRLIGDSVDGSAPLDALNRRFY
ncbi:hypothetical protein Y032_0305g1943 [Ancylostoma ceylanicum]|uniref:Uncharacterized protein n=1 Tax=Ancylostoma ceylanicum TaxID=53326 RepID=A0A016S423_9BILA|nr:hypothetical protein Y032_0305g1943 [Ancylostoma ceylanicum]